MEIMLIFRIRFEFRGLNPTSVRGGKDWDYIVKSTHMHY